VAVAFRHSPKDGRAIGCSFVLLISLVFPVEPAPRSDLAEVEAMNLDRSLIEYGAIWGEQFPICL
jgi:hypothetical protein